MRASHQRHVPAEGPSCSYSTGSFQCLTAGRSKTFRNEAAPFGRATFARYERVRKVLRTTIEYYLPRKGSVTCS